MTIFRWHSTPLPVVAAVSAGAPVPEYELRRVKPGQDEAAGAHGRVADHPTVEGRRALESGEESEGAGEGHRQTEGNVVRNEVEIEEDPEGPQVADGRNEAEEGEGVVGQAVECVGAAGVGDGKGVPKERKLCGERKDRRYGSKNL